MSDNIDAELGAAYDNAGGSNVIDTGASITPDNKPNPSEREAHIDDLRAQDDALTDELGAMFDRIDTRERAKEAAVPRVLGDNAHERVEAAYELSQLPRTEQRNIGLAQTALEQRIKVAEGMGIEIRDANGKVDAAKLRALDEIMAGDNAATKPEVLADELRQLLPRAQSQQEVAAAIQPYAQFEQDFRARGAQAFVDAAAQRGVHLADLSNPQHLAHIAAQYYGAPLHVLAERAGYVPVERVQELIAQSGAESTIAEWSRGRADFDAVRGEMAKVLQSPDWRDRPNESTFQTLERAYSMVKRQRSRRGPGKTAMDRNIESIADKLYPAEVA